MTRLSLKRQGLNITVSAEFNVCFSRDVFMIIRSRAMAGFILTGKLRSMAASQTPIR